jgi:hypothetical protein
MKNAPTFAATCVTALAASFALAAPPGTVREPAEAYIAHEWGTFTSVQGADGVQLEWHPLTTTDLPGFVYGPANSSGQPFSRDRLLKSAFIARQRRKPGHLLLRAARPFGARGVDFPEGTVTEWYPRPASRSRPERRHRRRLGWARGELIGTMLRS